MSKDNTTPIQQAIKLFDENWTEEEVNKSNQLKKIYATLLSLLPKEKDFINKVWGAAIKRTWAEYRSEVSSDTPDNKQFINQLYPEK